MQITLINSEDFVARLEKVLGYYDLTASAFADRVKVQRSSISHILSGRNKPSLEFVLKVINAFPEVDFYWLVKGKGQFPLKQKKVMESSSPTPISTPMVIKKEKKEKAIERIVVFYTDGSFKSYKE